MRGVTKLLLAAALAVLLTAGFAACGGDDSDDPAAGSAAATTEQTAPATAPEDDGSGAKETKEPSERAGDPGSSQEGSASFRTPGGDNSIQDFGDEADETEREAASVVVLAFMQARTAGDWEAVCLQLSSAALAQIDQLADRSVQLRGKDCAELLETLVGNAPAAARANTIRGGIDSLRFDGESGFALYHGTDGRDYYLPLVKEGESWRVGALGPSEFLG
jgi:hypothetical protein